VDRRGLINGSSELWDHNSAVGSGSARYARALITELSAKGLVPDFRLQPRIVDRVRHFGRLEASRLSIKSLAGVSATKVHWALGSGFAMTEFLVSPILGAISPPAICSLGALVNLMVVVCDRLLDAGAAVDEVLPESEHSSPVFDLLDVYRRKLADREPTVTVHRCSEKLIARMIESERQTVLARERLSYRDWLGKSALPFVLMGLPAWICRECTARARNGLTFSAHLLWLCRVGRFFGVLDDSLDYEHDLASGQPNCFRSKSPEAGNELCSRAAAWCANILSDWHRFAGNSRKAVIFRETFLNLTWCWLQPAKPLSL
jgi:hypothetical protein